MHSSCVDIIHVKKEVEFPLDLMTLLPEEVTSSRLKNYLPSCFRHGKIAFDHEKSIGVYCFLAQEACFSLGDNSILLLDRLQDRKRQKDGYVQLPSNGQLRAAEVYEGGTTYNAIDVKLDDSDGKLHVHMDIPREARISYTPPTEEIRTGHLVQHLRWFIEDKKLPLVVNPTRGIVKKVSVFSGGGDVSITSSHGCVVIGGTDMAMDEDDVTPLKEGDVATTTTIENKIAINSRSYMYHNCEQQLFANMHLSATHALVNQLFDGSIKPSQVERIVAYGSILKPGFNSVALYTLVAPCNSKTYVQVDYCVHTIYWHPFLIGYYCTCLISFANGHVLPVHNFMTFSLTLLIIN